MRATTRRLTQALREAEANTLQGRMAAILLAVNGLDNALEYVDSLRQPRVTPVEPSAESCSAGEEN